MRMAILALASTTLAAQGIEIDNDQVLVRRRVFSPREAFIAPQALRPAILVFLSDYHARFTYAGQNAEEIQGKPGEFYWHRGGPSGLENLTDRPIVMIRVALKSRRSFVARCQDGEA